MDLVSITIYLSIFIQLLIGLIGLDGFRYKMKPKDGILQSILGLETGVQFLELMFYIVFAITNIPLENLAGVRYYDWFFTTPTMLISSMMYFSYLNQEKNEEFSNKCNDCQTESETETEQPPLTINGFFNDNIKSIILIVIWNALMLGAGFLGELKIISILQGFIWGFIFFGLSFFEMFRSFVGSVYSPSFPMFLILAVIWSIYGILFPLPHAMKNISFNMLDLVSKNFYGLYIYYLILQKKIA